MKKLDYEVITRQAAAAWAELTEEDLMPDPTTGRVLVNERLKRFLRIFEGFGLVEREWTTTRAFTFRLTDRGHALFRSRGNA
jgi:hypothetical protein